MRLLRDIYNHYEQPNEIISVKDYLVIINLINLKNEDFNPVKFVPGSTGEGALYKTILKQTKFLDQ
ncbi:MAG: hypothetical protein GWP19_06700 [Planctomycetia bacterium]|nr:hypothetical protein [Planctomycetia bacterium]